jgi:hypothetical protein
MMRRRGVGVVGVAAVAHHAGKKGAQQQAAADQQAADAAGQQAAADQQASAAAAQAQAAAVPAVDPMTAQLENLANLHTQGILSDEEYAAAKAKALGI